MPDQRYNTGNGLTRVDEPRADVPVAVYEVTVTGPGVEVTRPVDEATLAGIIALLFGK